MWGCSTNDMFEWGKVKGKPSKYTTKKYSDYQKRVTAIIHRSYPKLANPAVKSYFPETAKVELCLYAMSDTNRKRDLDNLLKPLLDIFTKCRVFKDDSCVYAIKAMKFTPPPSKGSSKAEQELRQHYRDYMMVELKQMDCPNLTDWEYFTDLPPFEGVSRDGGEKIHIISFSELEQMHPDGLEPIEPTTPLIDLGNNPVLQRLQEKFKQASKANLQNQG